MKIEEIYLVEEQDKDDTASPIRAYTMRSDAMEAVKYQAIANIILGMDVDEIAKLAGISGDEVDAMPDEELQKLLMGRLPPEYVAELTKDSSPKGFYRWRPIEVLDHRPGIPREPVPDASAPEPAGQPTEAPVVEFQLGVMKLLQWVDLTDDEAAAFISLYKRTIEESLHKVALGVIQDIAKGTGIQTKNPF